MKFDVFSKEGFTVVNINEHKIYKGVVEEFKETLIGEIEKGNTKLILDFKDVRIINSSGLGVVFLAWYKVKDRDGMIRICSLNSTIREIFERIRLDQVFDVYDNVDSALRGRND